MGEIAQLVWLYVKRRPFIKESLRAKLVNYSSLARKISREIYRDQKNFNAIKVSLQRIAVKLSKGEEGLEEGILKLLKETSITIETKIAVIISRGELPIKAISSVKSRSTITYIAKEEEVKKIKNEKKIRLIQKNLNLITLISTEDIESTPGVVSLLLGTLASEGINVQEVISCYTDTLLVIKEADTTKAYEILNGITALT